jgi:CheY-like chemotaxis protein
MKFQALLVSTDAPAAAVLTPILGGFGLGVECCPYAVASQRLSQQKFDALLVDFDEPGPATTLLQNCGDLSRRGTITIALLSDRSKVRTIFSAGANFILYKPILPAQAEASLRAATALIRRERRRSVRVPVQVGVRLQVKDGPALDGILLDLSEDGLEVLSARPLFPSNALAVEFCLPEAKPQLKVQGEVAWAIPNGQSGVRFSDLSQEQYAALRAWVALRASRLPPEEPEQVTSCQLTDLSLGGCYMKTESPFPERSGVVLCLKAEQLEAQVQGMVRVMHPAFGMGVEFASSTEEERKLVRGFIEFLISRRHLTPELTVSPGNLPVSCDSLQSPSPGEESEFEDPLLDLLRNHDSLSQETFLEELQKQRSVPVEA